MRGDPLSKLLSQAVVPSMKTGSRLCLRTRESGLSRGPKPTSRR